MENVAPCKLHIIKNVYGREWGREIVGSGDQIDYWQWLIIKNVL